MPRGPINSGHGVPHAFSGKADPHRTPTPRISAMGPAVPMHIDPPKRSGGCKIASPSGSAASGRDAFGCGNVASQVGNVTSGADAFGGGRIATQRVNVTSDSASRCSPAERR